MESLRKRSSTRDGVGLEAATTGVLEHVGIHSAARLHTGRQHGRSPSYEERIRPARARGCDGLRCQRIHSTGI